MIARVAAAHVASRWSAIGYPEPPRAVLPRACAWFRVGVRSSREYASDDEIRARSPEVACGLATLEKSSGELLPRDPADAVMSLDAEALGEFGGRQARGSMSAPGRRRVVIVQAYDLGRVGDLQHLAPHMLGEARGEPTVAVPGGMGPMYARMAILNVHPEAGGQEIGATQPLALIPPCGGTSSCGRGREPI